MNVEYATLEADLESGLFRQQLEEELTLGFRQLHQSGERLPPASHYASQIAEIVERGADEPLSKERAFYLYQEVLMACENARKAVPGDEPLPS
ncbi:MAG TPA: hypothetical protein VGF48_05105 [Thermoanaerobaculia bacterium]|jgi:hypothetical protein